MYSPKTQHSFIPPPPRFSPPPPPPQVPPPFIPPSIPKPLLPVFEPFDPTSKIEKSLSRQELERTAEGGLAQRVRSKRAYTEGSPPERDISILCATLRHHQNTQEELIRNIMHLEKYILRQPSPYERGVDFYRDKCLDNASRKLGKNQGLLEKIKIQISTLKGQIPPEMLVSPVLKGSEKNRFLKKPNLFTNLKTRSKTRSKTWPTYTS